MKFKRNFFSTYILFLNTLMIVGIIPMLISMFAILDVEDSPNPIAMVGIILVVLLVVDIFFSIITHLLNFEKSFFKKSSKIRYFSRGLHTTSVQTVQKATLLQFFLLALAKNRIL